MKRNDALKLGEYFTLLEFVKSTSADLAKIDNSPSEEHIQNLKLLVTHVLDPVRKAFGTIIIKSGYRSPDLNRLVNGSKNSHHLRGMAADFTIPGVPNKRVCDWIAKNLKFTQVINEKRGVVEWIHCSYQNDDLKSEYLDCKIFPNGKAVYNRVSST